MLALAAPAEAEVVYTSAHSEILRSGHLFLDLNHDGKVDFEMAERSGCTTGGALGTRGPGAGQVPARFRGFCTSEVYVYAPFYHNHGNSAVGQRLFPFHAYALKP